MKRTPILHLLLAISLAAILPLEQAHCAWMEIGGVSGSCAMSAPSAAPAPHASSSSHACCRAKSLCAPVAPRPASGTQICRCSQVPAGTLPASSSLGATDASSALIAANFVRELSAPVSLPSEILPELDVGSAPLPASLGAHGLRAPPVSA